MKDNLGQRMKNYEKVSRTNLIKRMPVIIRLDGCHFHTWTKGLNKPFDKDLVYIMQETMIALCKQIQGCVLGYTQSDEITLVLTDYTNYETEAWYDNQVQKMCSVAASLATSAFEKALQECIDTNQVSDLYASSALYASETDSNYQGGYGIKANLLKSKKFTASFDARAFNLTKEEVVNNLIWRQQDATRNSINSLAQSLYSHKEIQGIGIKAIQDKMYTEKGVNWNNLPIKYKRGSCAIKDNDGKWFVDEYIPVFTQTKEYIEKRLL